MSINWTLERRELKNLTEHPHNPRKISPQDEEHLKKSLEKFGQVDKIIINTDGQIIGGHQRKKILKKMGIKEIDCWVPDRMLDEKEVDELNIRLNKNVGEFDFDILEKNFELSDLMEWGFSEENFPSLEAETVEPDDENQDTLSEESESITKLGDLWELGCHRLVCGDSTMADVVEKVLGGGEPILMVTDPPYGVKYDPSIRLNSVALGKILNDDRSDWSIAWALFSGNVAYVWHSGKFCAEVSKSLTDNGFEVISQIIWKKQSFLISWGNYHWQHEPCFYCVREKAPHHWQGAHDQSTVWEIANATSKKKKSENEKIEDERTCHSTQKPLECMSRPIVNSSSIGEGVYDPFSGSGTTLIACEKLGRICYAIELSPSYCDVCVNRWKRYMEKKGKKFTIKKNGEEYLFDEKNRS